MYHPATFILTGEKMAEFIDLLRTRRSTRDFENKAVPLDLVKEIIDESCLAPSAQNGQPGTCGTWGRPLLWDCAFTGKRETTPPQCVGRNRSEGLPAPCFQNGASVDQFRVFFNPGCHPRSGVTITRLADGVKPLPVQQVEFRRGGIQEEINRGQVYI